MLQPNDRAHLFESLRPPEGYSLDYGIGTTFTLDLLALLTAPLAFTTFDWADEDGHLARSPQALLATMQQYAERITIFCQTGKIAIPKNQSLLYSYLEESVVEVNAPRTGGLFHPKIWLLRFIAPEQLPQYRFLCLSRNLTFDRCWDTILRLDGQVVEDGEEFVANRPLSDFIRALPTLAHHPPLSNRIQTQIDLLGSELRRVEFERPPGFDQLLFHPLGLQGSSTPPIDRHIDRLLVVSPFVSQNRLQKLSKLGKNNILISRPEHLDQIPAPALGGFAQLFQVSPAANPNDEVDHDPTDATPDSLAGLHAKLYVADSGQKARIWTGSANATDAAFERNVEFLVELLGSKQQFGIDALLAFQDKEVTFRSLLESYIPPTEPVIDENPLEDLANWAEVQLLQLQLSAIVLPIEEPDQYCLQLQFEAVELPEFPAEIQVKCYPMTRCDLATLLEAQTTRTIDFKPLTCQAITSFFAFEIWTSDNQQKLSSFLLNVPLMGVPANRRQQILRSLLQDKNQVLKLLMFLLSNNKAEVRELLDGFGIDSITGASGLNASNGGSPSLFPVFEAMIRALDRNPMKLDHVARLVEDLRQLPEEEQVLPDNFVAIWQPIYTARQKLNR